MNLISITSQAFAFKHKDPWIAGDAVYQARAIMGWLRPCDARDNFGFKNGEINQETDEKGTITVYPNPSQDDFTIEFPFSEKADLLLLDLNGKVIYKQRVENSNKYLLNHNLKKGIYILHVRLDNHVNSSQKIVIE